MLFRLVQPVKRKGSSKHQFVQRIPTDILGRVRGMTFHIPLDGEVVRVAVSPSASSIRFSLRTSEPSEVKARHAEVAGYLEGVWKALRTDEPIELSHRQATALSKELYAAWADDRRQRTMVAELGADRKFHIIEDGNVEDPEEWRAALEALDTVCQSEDTERIDTRLGSLVDRMLLAKGIRDVTPASRRMLLEAFCVALRDVFAARERMAAGDYSPDPKASRFPEWTSPVAKGPQRSRVSLVRLVDDWWREAEKTGRAVSTYESYRRTFRQLGNFLGHDDAESVRPEDVVAYKDSRLQGGVSAKTVGDSDIAALRSVFQWAVDNRILSSNPAERVRFRRARPAQSRSKSFTLEEANAILLRSASYENTREHPKTVAAKRWVPWLCAYTGARVGELVQLRKEDVRQADGVSIVTITPEAGTVKDKKVREIVVHDHLIERGFIRFVEGSDDGYLFLNAAPGREMRGVWRSIKNRLRDFAREVVTDSRVAPNHAWRHLFKTLGREVGIADSVLDAICGHAPKSVGGAYGGVTLKAQAEAMARFPRFDVG